MKEEVSLLELLRILWKGKYLITFLTIGGMLIAIFGGFFLLSPQYEAVASVRIADNSETQMILTYKESIKNDITLSQLIEKLDLKKSGYDLKTIRNDLKIEQISNTSVIEITARGENPSTVAEIANYLAFELGTRVEVSDRSLEIVKLRKNLLEVEDAVSISNKEIEEAINQLKDTPEKLTVNKTLADELYLQSIVKDSTSGDYRELGTLQLVSEEINPVYNILKQRITEASINLTKQVALKENLQLNIIKNESIIAQLEQQLYDEDISMISSRSLLNGFNAVFIYPALVPENSIGPNKLLITVIGTIFGATLGALTVIIRFYLVVVTRNSTDRNETMSI